MITVNEVTRSFTIRMTPMATPRPRARIVRPKGKPEFVSIYNEPDYMKWKEELAIKIHNLKIPANGWNMVNVVFFIPMNKTDRNNSKAVQRIHGTLHEQKPDWDNFVKGFMDALQHTSEKVQLNMPIADDSAISSGVVRKVWINDPVGKIVFTLARVSIDPLYIMSL